MAGFFFFLFSFFFNDTATTEIYTLSLHDALPISNPTSVVPRVDVRFKRGRLPLSNFRLVPLTPEGADVLQCPTGEDLIVLNQGDVLSF